MAYWLPLAACLGSLPSALTRAIGGWMSDRLGARWVMYRVFAVALVCCGLLVVPQMDIYAPGSGVMARFAGTGGRRIAGQDRRPFAQARTTSSTTFSSAQKNDPVAAEQRNAGMLVLPHSVSWQEAVVEAGQKVAKRQLLARGVTHIFFQANLWIFTGLSLLLGTVMGIGMAAVYKHIPDYFPQDVGVVGGIVGVIGGLGGFVYPVIFGYLLQATGFWTTCWMLFFLLAMLCLLWMHFVVRKMDSRSGTDPGAESV